MVVLDKRGAGYVFVSPMKATCALVFVSAAVWHASTLVSLAAADWQDPNRPPGVARFDGEQTQEERNRAFTAALNYLATLGDEEARNIIQQAQQNNGQVSIDQEKAQAIIDRAAKAMQNGGKIDAPAADEKKEEEKKEEEKKEDDKPLFPPDEERVKKAIAALAKDGDEEAKEIIEEFKKTRKLDISDAKRWEMITRAVEKKLIKGEENDPKTTPKEEDKPKDEPAADKKEEADPKKDAQRKRAEDAVRALAKKGDKDARAVIDRSRRNRGDMQLTEEEMKTFIDLAVEKELIEPEKANPGGEPERMPPQQVKQLIKMLAERGDRDAKAIMRKAKKNEDDEIKYTDEEEAKIIEKAKKAGLIN